jgi:Tfp pilus assembly protein PilZ
MPSGGRWLDLVESGTDPQGNGVMLFKKSSKEKKSGRDAFSTLSIEAKGERLPSILIRLISKIRNHLEEFLFLEAVAREGLNLLQAHRSTIFIFDEKNQIFKAQCSLASDAAYETMGQTEEKEFARKMISFSKPDLVSRSKGFFKILNRESIPGQITSMTSALFFSNGKTVGAVLAIRFQARPPFNDFDHQVTSLLADLISLKKEMETTDNLRKTHERYLDDLLVKMQTPFPLAIPIPKQKEDLPSEPGQPQPSPEEYDLGVEGIITLQESDLKNRRQDERIRTMVRVEFEGHDLGLTDNLSRGGAFVRTLTPAELGDEFSMLLHLGDGGEPLRVNCKVVWTNQFGSVTKDLQRGMGIKFQKLPSQARTRIDSYIQQQKAHRPVESPQNGEKAE